jgi:hypothetical protein
MNESNESNPPILNHIFWTSISRPVARDHILRRLQVARVALDRFSFFDVCKSSAFVQADELRTQQHPSHSHHPSPITSLVDKIFDRPLDAAEQHQLKFPR